MTTENERLRALLAEAREALATDDVGVAFRAARRIDAALAEPVEGCVECARWEEYDEHFQRTVNDVVQRERDEARAECERLKTPQITAHPPILPVYEDADAAFEAWFGKKKGS